MAGFLTSHDKADCTGCGACVQCCHRGAIRLVEDQEGFSYPEVDFKACVNCHRCETVCPVDNSSIAFHNAEKGSAIAGFSRDAAIRDSSTSGGFFTGIVNAFLGNSGWVFGATSEDGLNVYHIGLNSIDDIGRIRKSKYAHSDTRRTFIEVRELLANGVRVVYSGTPCQIAGLYSFLGNLDKANLLTVDLVCHGYFSAKFLRKERTHYEKKIGSKAALFEYRNKNGGHWKGFCGIWYFDDGRSVAVPQAKLPYHRIWMQHLISRPSCHACRFARADRVADISLADFWHVENESPLFAGNRGTSLAFGNTDKGIALLKIASANWLFESVDRKWISGIKEGLRGPFPANAERTKAIADLDRLSYDQYVRKWSGIYLSAFARTRKVFGRVLNAIKRRI